MTQPGDPASLRAALDGADGVFLITPAFAPDATEMGLNLVAAAQAAGVRKIVYNGVYHRDVRRVRQARLPRRQPARAPHDPAA